MSTNVNSLHLLPARIPQMPPREAAVSTNRDEIPRGAGTASDAEPSLFEILTPEERAFFEQQLALGPLTYRAGGEDRNRLRAPTGGRLDVRA